MSTYRLVAMLLLTVLGNPAAAAEPTELLMKSSRSGSVVPENTAENPKRQSHKARKILAVLGTIGASNQEVRSLVSTVDSRIDKGYFHFTEHSLPDGRGNVTFRYRLNGSIDPILATSNKHGIRRLELNYRPSENSRWEAVATKKYVVVNYKIPLEKLMR